MKWKPWEVCTEKRYVLTCVLKDHLTAELGLESRGQAWKQGKQLGSISGIPMTGDGGTYQGDNNGHGEEWLDSESILKVEFTGYARDWMWR